MEPLYCAEQIRVPEQLPDILKQWTKEVIRQNPRDINEFSARYVARVTVLARVWCAYLCGAPARRAGPCVGPAAPRCAGVLCAPWCHATPCCMR